MATIAVLFAALAGLGYVAVPLVRDVAGIGRAITPTRNGNCVKIQSLSGCEDFWMHHESGLLYAACSAAEGKKHWFPGMANLHADQRTLNDAVYILDTNSDLKTNPKVTKVKTEGFSGLNGDGTFNLHGINVHVIPAVSTDENPTLRIFLNNHRPTLDVQGNLIDNTKTGANSTIEIFETTLGSDSMTHVRTWADPLIHTPNRVAPVDADGFLYTNDHQRKSGKHRDTIETLHPVANVGYCDPAVGCKIVYSPSALPNGLVRLSQHANRYLVPYSGRPHQTLFDFDPASKALNKVVDIPVGMPSDNVNMASNGDAFAASFPKVFDTAAVLAAGDPYNRKAPGTVIRIPAADLASAGADGWHIEKFYEADGSDVNVITNANLDVARNLLYLSGPISPHLSVCSV
ncbi:hypothetical protein K437DRAFT_235646 [Tilletiaria anomala UBC 951]|uniref:Calcium-dependent phosphotriesterase n=1 Tax=Tilletiaria anomala (strain ATCC 24038 / CBS 436.72 / UBC 951) TaxID=1037660 RepID=A0A066W3R7_TILAU|nr:uncharacterized protein K437DRAFT_235646 [Tilletiaria anomala UBC 951]KDN45734.1 hypothetical protein K437DRAFT_235646 [Tilletiaria anomala UBC 951]